VFGLGPGKSVDTRIYVDNEWLMLARQYGAVGLVAFLAWALALSRALIHSSTAAGDDVHYALAAKASLFSIAVYMFTAGFYESYQPMGIFLLMLLPLFRGRVESTASQHENTAGYPHVSVE
jgi:Trk-type K+ transport system membrane component